MNVEALWREVFGRHPSPDNAAEMGEFADETEMRLRAVFERTRRYNPKDPWAYAKAALLSSGPGTAPAPASRKSVLCDCCGKPYDADWMVLERFYAFCKGCVDFVRSFESMHRGDGIAGPFGVRREFTDSATITRQHFGLAAS